MVVSLEQFSDLELMEYEQVLYEREVRGEDTWDERSQVLREMNKRGLLCHGSADHPGS